MHFQIASEAQQLNSALFEVTHGLYILTACDGEKQNGQCLDALMQVTNRPPRIAISVGRKTLTHEIIIKTNVFVANVLDKSDPKAIEKIKHFGFQSGRNVDKFKPSPFEFERGELGPAILAGSKAFFECRVVRELNLDLKIHSLFVADVIRAGVNPAGDRLTYNEYRANLKKVSTPSDSPLQEGVSEVEC